MANQGSASAPNPPDLQQYVDQRLKEQAQEFRSCFETLNQQMQSLISTFGVSCTRTDPSSSGVFHPPQLHAAVNIQEEHKCPSGLLPTPVQGVPPQRRQTRPAPQRPTIRPLHHINYPPVGGDVQDLTRENYPFLDEDPLFGTEVHNPDLEEALPQNDLIPAHFNDPRQRGWESRFKLELSEFHGQRNAEDFLD